MFRRTCLAAGLFVLGLDTAAASAPVLPMPLGQDLSVEVVLNQPELAVDVSQTAANMGVQFGLIGAIVGVAVQNEQAKKAEAAVAPLRDLLIEYPFNEHFEKALHDKLASEGISPNPSVTILKTPWDAVDAQNSQHVPLHALVLYPHYSIDSGFAQLNVRLTADLVDREIREDGKVKTKIQFARVYELHLPLLKEEGADNRTRWQAMGKDLLEADLDEGIAQVTDIFVYDMSAKGRTEWSMDGDKVDVTIKGQPLHGVPIRQTQDWAWVRSGYTRGQSVQGIEPVSEHDQVLATNASSVPAAASPPSAGNAMVVPKPANAVQPAPGAVAAPTAIAAAAPGAAIAPTAAATASPSTQAVTATSMTASAQTASPVSAAKPAAAASATPAAGTPSQQAVGQAAPTTQPADSAGGK